MTSMTMNSAMSAITSGSMAGAGGTMPGSASTTSSAGGIGLTEQDFVSLITAQLKNQDPTQPTNPQDLANEFSDLATVNGINTLDTQVGQIQTSAQASELAQASTLIGQTVAINGTGPLTASNAGVLQGAFSLTATAQSAVVSVTNSATGKIVQNIPLSNLPAGTNTFSWPGATPGAQYTFTVNAVGSTGVAVSATPYGTGRVTAVNLSSTNPTVSIEGQAAPVPLTNIASIIGG